ncbi:MAG: hypothetical protein HPY44_13160 [Armatimonadetes bacterium]|nr:hypothetical protein [Armatimonadota bacterium]
MTTLPVAVTGIAPVCAVGIGREDFASGVAAGRDGRRPIERIEGDFANIPLVAECLDFAVEDYLESEKTYLDRCSELLLAACALAIEDAGLDDDTVRSAACGLAIGTAFGCLDSLMNVTARVQSKGVRFASPMIFTHAFVNSPASLAAIEYGTSGPASVFCTGDTSSATAIQYAFDLVRHRRAEVMLAGGVDALSAPLLRALDAGRLSGGIVPGEGCCLLVLESMAAAEERGAPVLAELTQVNTGRRTGPADQWPTGDALWGHAFGAEFALRVASALVQAGPAAEALATLVDESGRFAEAVLRREP